MHATVETVRRLRFDDGTPVRAASALAPLGDGWLIAQDDATHAAWRLGDTLVPVRVIPAVDGHEVFSEAEGTKHLKPDFEAACEMAVDGEPGVLLLGSGSSPRRMRASLVRLKDGHPTFEVADLSPLYARVVEVLGIRPDQLNLEGACRSGEVMRWFNRGNLVGGVQSASVDVNFRALVAAVTGTGPIDAVSVADPRTYDIGEADGVGLAITDAMALPDGRVLVSAAAEDTPNAVDDGPVVAAALALLDDTSVQGVAQLPEVDCEVEKVEGLALREVTDDGVVVTAVVDADDPDAPSRELVVRVVW